MMRDLVERRRWLTPEAMLADMAMAQALPGINVVNLPLWIGYRLYGGFGATVCALAVILPSAAVLALLAVLIVPLQRYPQTALAFEGAGAAAVGLLLATGLQAAKGVGRRAIPAAVMAITFAAVGVFKLPMLPVMLVMTPVSIALAIWERRRA
jgi:chromate transporter